MGAALKHSQTALLRAGAALLGGCLLAGGAGATTIDFNGLGGSDGSPFSGYTESGFTVTPLTSDWLVSQEFGYPAPSIILTTQTSGGSVAVTDGGAPFIYRSFVLYTTPYPEGTESITGLLNGSTVFALTKFGAKDTAVIDTLKITVTKLPNDLSNQIGVDNIVVGAPGSATGDPHLITFDGLHYNMQATGEFTLAKSTVAGNSFDVQIRTRSWHDGSAAAVVSEVAAEIGSHQITLDLDRAKTGGSFVWIDGRPASLDAAHPVLALNGGKIIRLSPSRYQVIWNTGEILYVTDQGTYLDADAWLSPQDGPGSVEGLLAPGGDGYGGFRLADGPSDLGDAFADTWRVTDATSLFNGGAAITTVEAAPDPAVPEPATITLLAIGLVGLGMIRRHMPAPKPPL